MVIVNFKLSEVGRKEVDIEGPEPLESVLRQCAVTPAVAPGHIIAVRRGDVMKGSDLVEDGDEIDIFPAISGG
jgi:molybdopterin converting factor small subunit